MWSSRMGGTGDLFDLYPFYVVFLFFFFGPIAFAYLPCGPLPGREAKQHIGETRRTAGSLDRFATFSLATPPTLPCTTPSRGHSSKRKMRDIK
uniref:Uncharacterized protein n=1 Tax=Anopheles darlingi TaxID=43151 RepID=A0A2M4DL92_ANODA